MCGVPRGGGCRQRCRGELRDAFPSDSESKLIEREKRAHCYDPKLLDQVLLSTPPLPCHKSCLAGVRALLRLYNSAAIGGPGEPRLGSGANFHVTFCIAHTRNGGRHPHRAGHAHIVCCCR